MKKQLFFFCALVPMALLCSCGNNPAQPPQRGSGQLHLWAHVLQSSGLSKSAKTTATSWDSLIVSITSTDMDTLRRAVKFDASNAYVNFSLTDVPAGKSRSVEVWTINRKGMLIHASLRKKIDIASGEIKTVDVLLLPKRGSIYIDLANVPVSLSGDTIAAVYADFRFGSQVLSDSAQRSKSLFLSIDNVPDSASGTLSIFGLSSTTDTLYRCSCALTFYALKDTTFSVKAAAVSTGVSLSIAVINPGVTIIRASVDTGKTIGAEHGPLIISEIMYAANDSEYIELYNPLDKDTTFDTLFLDIDGSYRAFSHVAVQAHGFFVFGRKNLPWVNAIHPVASALDLLMGGGNTIVVRTKDSLVMDWVACAGSGNNQGWPSVGSAKKSIVLDSLFADPTYNNYGKHWVAAITPINQTDPKNAAPATSQCGTPGFKGK
ncbi:MAG TPA: hypothetical protein VF335_05670 [Chitinivibrionales bacterium]